jgi:biopolymer transport protein ExbB
MIFFENLNTFFAQTLGLTIFQSLNSVSTFIAMLLFMMSIFSCYLIIVKFVQLSVFFLMMSRWENFFTQNIRINNNLSPPTNHFIVHPCQRIWQHSHTTLSSYPTELSTPEWIARTLRLELQREKIRLEAGLSGLASISSTAPFLGLLGTVVEIYITLKGLGSGGTVSLNIIAPPIGNALILTATGLAVAIPTALGYNLLLRLQRVFLNRLDSCVQQLHVYLLIQGIQKDA